MSLDSSVFTVCPPFRCFGQPSHLRGEVCCRPAAWTRPTRLDVAPTFFCDRCKQPTDVPIVGDELFRRVTVTLDVMFASVSLLPAAAHTEAVARLDALLRPHGGVICLHGVTSQVGRYTPPPETGATRAGKGRG